MPITNVAFLIAQLPTTLCGNLIQARGRGLQPSLDASPPPSGLPGTNILLRWWWMAVVMARKKHFAQSGSRATKGKVANAIRRDEIVEAVVDNTKPWRNHESRDTVTAAVNQALDALLRLVPFEKKFFDPRPARKHAKKLDKAISKVETLVTSCPGMLGGNLFDPTLPLEKVGLDPTPYKSLEECVDAFLAELTQIRKVCALDYYGPHPNYDPAKHLSAEFAHRLTRKLSDQKITGTEDGAFRTIAGLLYEVVTGQPDVDLKRACDAVLAGCAESPN